MKKDTTRSIELCTESLYLWLNISLKFEPACSLILLTKTFFTLPVVETQSNEDFNCTFSGCVGENVVCYCSVNVSDYMIQWWDDQATLCQSFLNNSRPFISVGSGLRAEVVSGSTHPTGAFTSKLTLNVSTERNGSKVGCTRSPSTSCTPSNTDPNIFEFQILVKDCSEISGIIIV